MQETKPTPKKQVDRRAIDLLLNGTQEERLYLCSLDPKYFAIYYFSEYFDYTLPSFHLDFYDDVRRLVEGELDEVAWIAYRESAKTSIAKIAYITWMICYQKKRYINVDSYDKANAEATLFDVTLHLQTNQKIIADFGHLYYRKTKTVKGDEDDEGTKMKRMGSFITENRIKCEAFSTQESTRGRLFGIFRPDAYLLDDLETSKTKDSAAIKAHIISHINELKGGLSTGACILYLGNHIIEEGVVSYIMDGVRRLGPRGVVRNIPVVDNAGVISWPDKYVKTDKEAAEANKDITDPRRRKVSLEAKRRALGDEVFEAEMMNNPGKTGDYYFNRAKVKLAMLKCFDPEEKVGELKVWFPYDPMHTYAIGADTSEGIGRDSNASAIINFKMKPATVVATYANSKIPPNVFAWELKNQGHMYGKCIICPEMNNTGYATLAELQNIYDNIYQREVKHRISNQLINEWGWRTTLGNKWEILGNLKSSWEAGELDIFDIDLLTEMYHFRKADLNQLKVEEGMTRHFDKLMAAAIAWEMRRHVQFSVDDKKGMFKSPQKKYEGI